MALTKIRLGDFIELYSERCGNPNLTVYDVSGINADKEFLSLRNKLVQILVIIKMFHLIILRVI